MRNKKKHKKQRSGHVKEAGLAPGSLVYVGVGPEEPVQVSLFEYVDAECEEQVVKDLRTFLPIKGLPTITWLNIDGLHDIELIREIGQQFNLHPLILEDIVHTGQRPKIEDMEDYIFLVARMLRYSSSDNEVISEQVSFVLGPNYVLSFQERAGDVFDPLRERIRVGKGRIRKSGADYLAYALLDSVVDGYFSVIEQLGDHIELLEEELASDPSTESMREIYRLKRETIALRRAVWPLREVIASLEREPSALIAESTHPFLRDLYGHSVHVVDSVETLRDLVSGMLDLYLSSVSNRMNEVMKILTIMATIFIPLTFVAGIYGMNFDNMPELHWQWGYPLVYVLMSVIAGLMLWFFRKKNWI